MIAVDTNILLRYIVQDDPGQTRLASDFVENNLSSGAPGYVSLVVICEIVWALDKTYQLPRETVAATLRALIQAPQLQIEDDKIVIAALAQTACGIADAIIHFAGRAKDCSKTITFDRKFARLEGVELLS